MSPYIYLKRPLLWWTKIVLLTCSVFKPFSSFVWRRRWNLKEALLNETVGGHNSLFAFAPLLTVAAVTAKSSWFASKVNVAKTNSQSTMKGGVSYWNMDSFHNVLRVETGADVINKLNSSNDTQLYVASRIQWFPQSTTTTVKVG